MKHAHTHTHRHGRRLTALAVTAVLAATGGTLAAPSAIAAVPAATADTTPQETAVRFPLNAEVVSAGTSGFLSKTNTATPEYRWTRYADGTSTVLPAAALVTGGVSDIVVTGENAEPHLNRFLKIHDMTSPSAAPVEVDLDELGADYWFAGAIGSTLIAMVETGEAGWLPHLITAEGGSLTHRPVTGMPEGACDLNVTAYSTNTAVFDCGLGLNEVRGKVVVDLTTATAVSAHVQAGSPARLWEAAVSSTHVAWHEWVDGARVIGAARRGSTETKRIRTKGYYEDSFRMLGEWVTVGEPRPLEYSGGPYGGVAPTPPRPLTAESAETGETVDLLAHLSSAVPAPDGSLMVRGGTPAEGEGLYQVALGADGKPVATLVASTGQATAVTLLGSTVPTVFTGDQLAKGVDLSWDLSRGDAYVWATLVHVRTGQRLQWPLVTDGGPTARRTVSLRWNGRELTGFGSTRPALNGEYTWEIAALPDDGIGPDLKATGRFTVSRPVAPHDYDDNGTPDVFVRDGNGALVRLGMQRSEAGDSVLHEGGWNVGGGWQIYDRMESVGNVAGTSVADSIARDKSGVLWLYQGTGLGAKPLQPRTKIGGGWQIYDQLAGGSDLTNDGKADLLATDKSGVLWLYGGTGNANAPFATRKKIGWGWGIYNQLTAVGNIAGAAAGDLLARDKDGVLWLYLGKGDGTFASRIKIGGGWNTYKDLIGIGDGNGDGRPDLFALKQGTGKRAYFYAGTGDWRAPFRAGKSTGVLPDDVSYDTGF
ncbi:FG-GAP-like repeat-containing protein [Streptomyces vilmorinianum]|uniref:FG-GAP-like repeat-containing protein n=1 Tax=Streptomyces vilmorinianum TaxID=3051092 RepID=UPI0010FAF246|nr:FG-GAP-like repeat-containing protein [Streptomyces vilmorinianum]